MPDISWASRLQSKTEHLQAFQPITQLSSLLKLHLLGGVAHGGFHLANCLLDLFLRGVELARHLAKLSHAFGRIEHVERAHGRARIRGAKHFAPSVDTPAMP